MNKEFITYEQAIELKELGFDEPTSFYWEDNVIRPLPMKDEVCAFYFNRHTRTENEWICAPLYQQAFRWFREKHKLLSVIDVTIDGKWFLSIYNLNAKRNDEIECEVLYYDTYEESELACLKKLIEIVTKN